MSNYIFADASTKTAQRFRNLESLFDAWTIGHLEATKVRDGWRCWEVGGGGGSIANWMAERCGPSGRVLVTDIDPNNLEGSASHSKAHIEVKHHDIVADPMQAEQFDLIHARLLLIHLRAREQALARLVSALKPGGWLVIEDFDLTLIDASAMQINEESAALYNKMQNVLFRLMSSRAGPLTLTWGRSLYRRFISSGLTGVGMEGYSTLRNGGSPGAQLAAINFQQIRTEAIATGEVTDADFERMLTLLQEPNFAVYAPILYTAWGQRPT